MVTACPYCGSLLFTEFGEPSLLDGKRYVKCLSCLAPMQPHRNRLLLRFFFALAIIFPTPLFIAGWVFLSRFGIQWVTILSWPAALGCAYAAYEIRRVLRLPMPAVIYRRPSDNCRLVSFSSTGLDDRGPDVWRSANKFVSGVLETTAAVLGDPGLKCQFTINVTCKDNDRYCHVRKLVEPEKSNLTSALELLPVFSLPEDEVRFVFEFTAHPQ